jgi:uncharacterized protein (DUF58 family)
VSNTAFPIGELHAQARSLAAGLPALLAEAERLASWVNMGEHGRKRAGSGEEFWQYRAAQPGDSLRMVDWRRSARSESQSYVREREWQVAQSLILWVDPAQSMEFAGAATRPTKAARARLMALAVGLLALKAGERVALPGQMPRAGRAQEANLAAGLLASVDAPDFGDYEGPSRAGLPDYGRVMLLSDFLGPMAPLKTAMIGAAERGMRGVLLQVLDPDEMNFPFRGRVRFESMTGAMQHETQSADALAPRYREKLAERQAELRDLGRALGWPVGLHVTGDMAGPGLAWAHAALSGVGR